MEQEREEEGSCDITVAVNRTSEISRIGKAELIDAVEAQPPAQHLTRPALGPRAW